MDYSICKNVCGRADGCMLLWSSVSDELNYAVWVRKDGSKDNLCGVKLYFNDYSMAALRFFNLVVKDKPLSVIVNHDLALQFFLPPVDCPFYAEHLVFDLNRK